MSGKNEEEEIDNSNIVVDGKFYHGNDNILRQDGTFKWTPERVSDFKLCHKSILHFAENHFYIISLDRGKERINLYKYQKRLLKAFKSNRFNVVLSSRQSGKCVEYNTVITIKPQNSNVFRLVKIGDLYQEIKKTEPAFGGDGIKIVESYNLPNLEILSDTGWEKITHIHKTVPYEIWQIKTEKCSLKCADTHLVINENGNQVWVKDLKIGDKIKTVYATEKVTEVYKTESKAEAMYDVTVDSANHTFYSNGILSHNTTTITIYALWIVCFHNDKKVTIVANKESTAKEIFARIQMAYEQLPVHIKPAMKSWRKDGFNLSNGSAITISTTSAAGPRGSSSNLLIIDEMAHCPQEIMKELWRSAIPIVTASETSQIVVISTPNGTDNKFYELYQESLKEKSPWHLERVEWTDVPGRDEKWKKQAIELMGGSEDDFNQEYGNVFTTPGKALIDSRHLEELRAMCPEPALIADEGCYKIFCLPRPDSFYVVGVDVGEGIGRSNTVAQIFDVSNLQNIQQVAVYASNSINPYHFGSRLMSILNDWGRPPVLVESNNYGQQVLDVLHQAHNYESIVSYHLDGNSKHYRTEMRKGIFNHTNTRYNGITNFRYWADGLKAVKFNDPETLYELNSFVRLPNQTFSKRTDKDLDDRVFGCIWALFILMPSLVTSHFYVEEYDDQGRPNKMHSLVNNKDLLLKSPLLLGNINNNVSIKNRPTNLSPSFIMPKPTQNDPVMEGEAKELWHWLHTTAFKDKQLENPKFKENLSAESKEVEHRPVILF